MKPTIRRAEMEDANYIANHLRSADALELRVAHPNVKQETILRGAIQDSYGEAYVLHFGHSEPCILFGVAPVEPGIGTLWMVCTPGIDGHAISILREARIWIDYWHRSYALLANLVEARNVLHLRWLMLLGARFEPYGQRNGVEVLLFNL